MEQDARAVGIDLGTTYSCIAHIDDYGQVMVIPNQEGTSTTPSVVLFEENTRVVGDFAKNVSRSQPDDVVSLVKRAMGNADWRKEYQGDEYRPEDISAFILRKLVNDAEEALRNVGDERPIKKVVITCPAYFRIPEIEATRQAGEIAGLDVLAIVQEPVAAAIAWGAGKAHQPDQRILVYDLGGGTFDATFIDVDGDDIKVVATGGDHDLGGRNWDERIVSHLTQRFLEEHPTSSDPQSDPHTLNSLFTEAENLKKTITRRGKGSAAIHHDGNSSHITVTQEEFDNVTADLLEQTVEITRQLLERVRDEIGHPNPTPDQILLVGGSTYMPQVAKRIEEAFGLSPIQFDPDQAVAKGAAIYAQMLLDGFAPNPNPVPGNGDSSSRLMDDPVIPVTPDGKRVIQATSHSFGVVVVDNGDEVVANLISLSTALPASATQTFGTLHANQTSADIRIMENTVFGDRAALRESHELGNAELPLPPGLPAGAPIEITFVLDISGTLHATAKDITGGQVISVNIEIPSRMTEREVEKAKSRALSLQVE